MSLYLPDGLEAMKKRIMARASLPQLLVVAACLGMAGCATAPTEGRARIADLPLASTHADIAFTMTTGSRRSATCEKIATCPPQAERDIAIGFALQVERVAGILQTGAESLYPDLAQRVPELVDHRFDVYIVDGDQPGSASSANGRIALNAALGVRQRYDDWVAFVIAREMGHVIAHHQEENSSASIATSVIMNILIPGSSLLKTLISAGGSGIAAKSQREVQALEADAIALELLQAAGFPMRDLHLALRIEPALPDDGPWSKSFRDSSANLLAAFRRSEFAVAALR